MMSDTRRFSRRPGRTLARDVAGRDQARDMPAFNDDQRTHTAGSHVREGLIELAIRDNEHRAVAIEFRHRRQRR